MGSSDASGSAARLRYVRGLDGLRALAVVAVVIYHAAMSWLPGGFLGVDVFFVLSGYLITSQLLAEWQRRGEIDLLDFWRRRARRILPALYFLLAVTLAFALVFHPHDVPSFRGDAVAAFAYVANWYFIVHHLSYFEAVGRQSPFLHLWSLGVEEQFYVLWPVLFSVALIFLRRRTPLAILAGAGACTVLMAALFKPGTDPSIVYYGTDTHASGLLLGAFLACVWTPHRVLVTGSRRERHPIRAFVEKPLVLDLVGTALLAALALAFLKLTESDAALYRGGFTVVAAMTALAVVAVSHGRARLLPAVLEWKPVRWLGQRSYSIYLWHWPVIVFTRPHVDVPFTGLALIGIQVASSLILAEISYRFVEEPLRSGALGRLGHRLHDAWQAREWQPLALFGASSVMAGALVLWLAVFSAQAQPLPPPPELAIGEIHMIAVPTAAAAPLAPVAAATPPPAVTSASVGSEPQSAIVSLLAPANPAPAQENAPAASPPSPEPAASPEPSPEAAAAPPPIELPVATGRVVAIGDSVMLGAASTLAWGIQGIEIDAAVSRQVSSGIQVLRQTQANGALSPVVIIALGSNGTFTSYEFDQIMAILADVPKVVFVNDKVPRTWEAGNNVVIATGVQRYPNARLVNWHAAGSEHPEYFINDEIHLRPAGANAYVTLIATAILGP